MFCKGAGQSQKYWKKENEDIDDFEFDDDDDYDEKYDNAAINLSKKVYFVPKGTLAWPTQETATQDFFGHNHSSQLDGELVSIDLVNSHVWRERVFKIQKQHLEKYLVAG